jgi:preprotein translocase subunit SecA
LKRLETIRDDRSKDEVEKKNLILEYLIGEAKVICNEKETLLGKDTWNAVQKSLYLRSLDTLWMNHLDEIDYLRQGIGLRGYGQRDPLIEYKREAYDLFLGLMDTVRKTYLVTILKISPATAVPQNEVPRDLQLHGASEDIEQFQNNQQLSGGSQQGGNTEPQKPLINQNVTGRNDPCPCGSGKKFKKCHGA